MNFISILPSRQLLADLLIIIVIAIFSVGTSIFFRGTDQQSHQQALSHSKNQAIAQPTTDEEPMDPLIASMLVSSTGRSIPYPPISLSKFKQYREWGKGLVIDVRSTAAYNKGHIQGAVSLPVSSFEELYPSLESQLEPYLNQLIILYCSNSFCTAADSAQDHLIRHGYKYVGIYVKGFHEWANTGGAVETSAP